jgi:hypothetical protein
VAAALRLARAADGRRSVRFWAGGFAAIGAAAVLGGTWHAFAPRLAATSAELLWKATLAATGVASCLLIAGAAFASLPRRPATWVAGAAAIKLAVFLAAALPRDAFDPVVVDSGATLCAILVLQGLALVKIRARSAPWVIAGVVVSAVAAAVETLRPEMPLPFGPDAAYHLVQLAGLLLLLRGGLLFSDS